MGRALRNCARRADAAAQHPAGRRQLPDPAGQRDAAPGGRDHHRPGQPSQARRGALGSVHVGHDETDTIVGMTGQPAPPTRSEPAAPWGDYTAAAPLAAARSGRRSGGRCLPRRHPRRRPPRRRGRSAGRGHHCPAVRRRRGRPAARWRRNPSGSAPTVVLRPTTPPWAPPTCPCPRRRPTGDEPGRAGKGIRVIAVVVGAVLLGVGAGVLIALRDRASVATPPVTSTTPAVGPVVVTRADPLGPPRRRRRPRPRLRRRAPGPLRPLHG